ncbi:MAG: N-methyl-L-tryptophan oxidase [Terriglobia bacterium]
MNGEAKKYEVIVAGAGAMGSATLYHLARRGIKALGLERFEIPHTMGSSHGVTRIIRLAYSEHPSYVPLLRRAYELWRDLEKRSGRSLLHITGGIDAGPAGSAVLEGSLESCRIHNLPHEVLSSAELSARFPAYRLPAETMAVYQPDAGFLAPEACIEAHVKLAEANGAEIHTGEPVVDWEVSGGRVTVRTPKADYEAEQLVIAAGAWVGKLVPSLAGLARPERQVLAWFQPQHPDLFAPARFPVFNLEFDQGRYYGLPIFGVPGFKVGKYHHRREPIDPDDPRRDCGPEDEELLQDFVRRCFPDGAGAALSLLACIFTNTPDEHFILDRHPEFPEVLIASPCSGHGFKFSSVIGEIMADLAERGETSHDISLHRLARFGARGRPQNEERTL